MPHRCIETPEHVADFVRLLRSLKLPFTVEWRKGKARSLEQNSLQWVWAAEVAQQKGETVAEVQADWKLRHGVPILRGDSQSFRETYDRLLKPLSYEDKLRVMRDFDIGITRLMGVRQMTRYLDAVQRECLENGLHLTDPEGRI